MRKKLILGDEQSIFRRHESHLPRDDPASGNLTSVSRETCDLKIFFASKNEADQKIETVSHVTTKEN